VAARILSRWLPPVLADAARALRDAMGTSEWHVAPDGFTRTPRGAGWEDESIVATQAARWAAYVQRTAGTGPLGFSGESESDAPQDDVAHNSAMVFAYTLARASHGRERMALLDWGGGLGQYGVLARALMPEVEIDYHCRDLAHLAARGRTLLAGATFHDDDTCLARRYDLVLASSSLQYHEDWRGALAKLAAATEGFLLVTRMPVTLSAPGYVVVQRPHRHGYMTEYPGWVLDRDELISAGGALGLVLQREFLIGERPRIPGAPSPCEYRGFLWRAERVAGA
jgi:putative methyltransferase (TIGR04325 family)